MLMAATGTEFELSLENAVDGNNLERLSKLFERVYNDYGLSCVVHKAQNCSDKARYAIYVNVGDTKRAQDIKFIDDLYMQVLQEIKCSMYVWVFIDGETIREVRKDYIIETTTTNIEKRQGQGGILSFDELLDMVNNEILDEETTELADVVSNTLQLD